MMMNTIDVLPDHKQNFDENKPAQWNRAKNQNKTKQKKAEFNKLPQQLGEEKKKSN